MLDRTLPFGYRDLAETGREFARGFVVMALREVLKERQELAGAATSILSAVASLILMGFGLDLVVDDEDLGTNYRKFIYPGILVMVVAFSSWNVGMTVYWDHRFGSLKQALVSPLSRTGMVAGKIAGGSILALLQVIVLLALAPAVDVTITPLLVPRILPHLILLCVLIASMGMLIGLLMPSPSFFPLTSLLTIPLTFLSGAFFPVNLSPTWLESLTLLNPVTYGMDAVRSEFLMADPTFPGMANTGIGAFELDVFGHRFGLLEDFLVVAGVALLLVIVVASMFQRKEWK